MASFLRTLIAPLLLLSLCAPAASFQEGDHDEAAVTMAEPPPEDAEVDEGPTPWYRRIIPIPVVITEPAIGEGLGLALGYFHPDRESSYVPKRVESTDVVRDVSIARDAPPTITGVVAAATTNGTWAVGGGHIDSFRNDTIRFLGYGGYANVVSELYLFGQPFEFELTGMLLESEVKFRINESNWFLGASVEFYDANTVFRIDLPDEKPPIDFLADDFRDVGLALKVMRETRDDTIFPSDGQLLDITLSRNDDAFGGDYEYTTLKAKFHSFHPFADRWVLGWRVDYSIVDGAPPFYAVPWITLRGIPALRYQGDEVLVGEVEGRYQFNDRWAAVAFGGRGYTSSDFFGIEDGDDIYAFGAGGRFLLLQEHNAWVGIDIARGPEDTYYYIQVGHPW